MVARHILDDGAVQPCYFLFFHVGDAGWTVADSWNAEQSEEMRKRFSGMGELKNDTATILKYKDDEKWMIYARSVFLNNCQSCHGPDGGGVIGPNLTDDYYRNIHVITDFATVIENGAGGGQMPTWRGKLHPNEIILMAAYVAKLRVGGDGIPGSKKRDPDKDKLTPPPWSTAADAAKLGNAPK